MKDVDPRISSILVKQIKRRFGQLGKLYKWVRQPIKNLILRYSFSRKLAYWVKGRVDPTRGNVVMPGEQSIVRARARLLRLNVAGLERRVETGAHKDEESSDSRDISIAIVIPTFNDSRFLKESLESVRCQTYTNWRCYVVDDASHEDTSSVFRSFRKDDRFTLLRHAKNAGLSAARNTAIRVAHEDLVQFLDADDFLTPWALEARVAEYRKHAHESVVAGVYGQILQCPEETSFRVSSGWTARFPRSPVDFLSTDGEAPFNVHAPLVRLSVLRGLGGFDESYLNGAEDWEMWHRVMRHGYRFVATDRVVGGYRQRTGSMIRQHALTHMQRADELLEAAETEVMLNQSLVVGSAFMPLSRSRQATRRAVRVARWLGIETASTGVLPESSSPLLPYLDAIALVEAEWPKLVSGARGGIIRGLGLSVHNLRDMDTFERSKIGHLAESIADLVLSYADSKKVERTAPTGRLDLRGTISADIGLLASTPPDLPYLLAAVDFGESECVAIDVDQLEGDHGTQAAWRAADIPIVSYNEVALGRCRPKRVLAVKPFGPATIDMLEMAVQWGAKVEVLEHPGRNLSVPQSPSTGFKIPTKDSLEKAAESTSERSCGSYSSLLAKEETQIDEESFVRLMELKDTKKGETCVVIGNGPSLNQIDFDLLRGVPTFGVNSIFLAQDRLPRPLSYYVVEDTSVFRENTEAIKNFEAGLKIFPTLYRQYFTDEEIGDNTLFFRMNMGFYGRDTGTACYPRFSTDAAQRLFSGQSVTIINLQLAYWLGFETVSLIGMDFSYMIPEDAVRSGDIILSKSDDPNHFHPDYFGAGKTWKDPKLDRVLVNYRRAKEMFEADGRRIVNSTVGGKLEVFDRVDLSRLVRS